MKITLFLLLATAVVGRAQTTTELLPVGTEAPDFQITNDKTGEKIFRLPIGRPRPMQTARWYQAYGPYSTSGLHGVQTVARTCQR